MEFTVLLQKVKNHFKDQLPFVIYSLPDTDDVTVMFQKDTILYETEDFLENSFVFTPFNFSEKAYCIPHAKSEVVNSKYGKEEVVRVKTDVSQDFSEEKKHLELLDHTITTLKSKKATKIVLSRCKTIKASKFNLKQLLTRLLNLYPTAFRYIWYHPKTGFWCGASPELFVETEGISFKTMALAGTKIYKENKKPNWSYKEIFEQQVVVDQVVENLQKATSILKVSKSYNHIAGSLIHIRTDITGILKKGKTSLQSICKALHPTPAVCGAPQKFAKEYINSQEDYAREFYTGFLGPICKENNCSSLFVNLRCMKIDGNLAKIYVGGGITMDSVPESEWEETVNKLQTMLQVLQPML